MQRSPIYRRSFKLWSSAATKQLIRDFDEKGVFGWHFAKDDIGLMCEYFVLPYITDPNTEQFYEQSSDNNWEAANLEDFSWLISLLVKLCKCA